MYTYISSFLGQFLKLIEKKASGMITKSLDMRGEVNGREK